MYQGVSSMLASIACAMVMASLIVSEPLPTAKNVCNNTRLIKEDITIRQPKQYVIEYNSNCLFGGCSKKRVETRIDEKIQTSIRPVIVPECCPGYTETPERQCVPICEIECRDGAKCVAPNICKCDSSDNDSGCMDSNQLSRIAGSDISIDMPVHSGALIRTPDDTESILDDRSSFGTNCLVGGLSCASLILLIALLLIKRRYDRLKSEVCYAAGSNPSSGGGDIYSTSDYSTAQRSLNSEYSNNSQMSKNLSFASATRNALLGSEGMAAAKHHSSVYNTQTDYEKLRRNKSILNPLVESHLIRSHKPAEQNLYSDIEVNFSERPLPNPVGSADESKTSIDMSNSTLGDIGEDHIYQVPRSTNVSHVTQNCTTINDASFDSTYKSLSGNEDEIIYEEIRSGGHQDSNET